MKELFIIISGKNRGPVPRKFKEKFMKHFRGSKILKAYQILASYLLAREIVSMKALYVERSSKTYIYYTYI